MMIESIVTVKRRVVIRLEAYSLILTDVSKFTKNIESFSTAWLCHKWEDRGETFALSVETELGPFDVVGRDQRLLRNVDLAVLIPAIDA